MKCGVCGKRWLRFRKRFIDAHAYRKDQGGVYCRDCWSQYVTKEMSRDTRL